MCPSGTSEFIYSSGTRSEEIRDSWPRRHRHSLTQLIPVNELLEVHPVGFRILIHDDISPLRYRLGSSYAPART